VIVNTIIIDGVDRVVWDSDQGVVTYEADGATVTSTRPFTDLEQRYVAFALVGVNATNTATLNQDLITAIDTMLTGLTQVQEFAAGTLVSDATINANPAVYMKLVAAELVEVEQNVIAVARLASGQTESPDTGGK